MPNTHTTLTSLFSDIADAIRAKTGDTAEIVADGFPDQIAAIPQGGSDIISKTIRANGMYNAAAEGHDGYSRVLVAVDRLSNRYLTLRSKTVEIGANTVSNTAQAHAYFAALAAAEGVSNYISVALADAYTKQNQVIHAVSRNFGAAMSEQWSAYRVRSGAAASASWNSASCDCTLVQGTQYVMIFVDSLTVPV